MTLALIKNYLSDKLDDAANGKPKMAMPRSVTASIPRRKFVDVLRLRSSASRANTKELPVIAKAPVRQEIERKCHFCSVAKGNMIHSNLNL